MLKFRLWLEDIYGFEKQEQATKPEKDGDLPIKQFSVERLMRYLSRNPIGQRLPQPQKTFDTIQFGDTNDGALRVKLTPNTNLSIERLITGLNGEPCWINKKFYRIKDNEFAGQENVVAQEIYQKLIKVNKEKIDSGSKEFDKLPALTKRISDKIEKTSNFFVKEKIKQISEYNYNILLSAANFGRGVLATSTRTASAIAGAIVDISFDKKSGMIKCIFYTIDVEYKGGDWNLQTPYFIASYAASQPLEEIINSTVSGINLI